MKTAGEGPFPITSQYVKLNHLPLRDMLDTYRGMAKYDALPVSDIHIFVSEETVLRYFGVSQLYTGIG